MRSLIERSRCLDACRTCAAVRFTASAAMIAGLVLLAGCAQSRTSNAVDADSTVTDPGAPALVDQNSTSPADSGLGTDLGVGLASMLESAKEDFAAIAAGRLNPSAMPGEPGDPTLIPEEAEPASNEPPTRPSPDSARVRLASDSESEASDQGPEPNVDEVIAAGSDEETELASRLAWLIRERAVSSADPAEAALTLAMLESIHPGLLDDLDRDEPGGLGRLLAPSEIEAVAAVRRIAAAAAGEPGALADLFEQEARTLGASAGVRLGEVAMCSRVSGFGQFIELEHDSFVRGREPRMLVYTEVERFGHRDRVREDGGADNADWTVELTQELLLMVDGADRGATWRLAPQRVVQTSRRKIRDLFLVQEVTLPANLSLGSYSLVIRITDVTTGSVAEKAVPLRIVAQPVAIR